MDKIISILGQQSNRLENIEKKLGMLGIEYTKGCHMRIK